MRRRTETENSVRYKKRLRLKRKASQTDSGAETGCAAAAVAPHSDQLLPPARRRRRRFHQQPEVNYLPRFSPQLISLESCSLRLQYSRKIDLLENLDIFHITLLVVPHRFSNWNWRRSPRNDAPCRQMVTGAQGTRIEKLTVRIEESRMEAPTPPSTVEPLYSTT